MFNGQGSTSSSTYGIILQDCTPSDSEKLLCKSKLPSFNGSTSYRWWIFHFQVSFTNSNHGKVRFESRIYLVAMIHSILPCLPCLTTCLIHFAQEHELQRCPHLILIGYTGAAAVPQMLRLPASYRFFVNPSARTCRHVQHIHMHR